MTTTGTLKFRKYQEKRAGDFKDKWYGAQLALLARRHPRCIDRHALLLAGTGTRRQVGTSGRAGAILHRHEHLAGCYGAGVYRRQHQGRASQRAQHQDLEQPGTAQAMPSDGAHRLCRHAPGRRRRRWRRRRPSCHRVNY